jgi:hypothetical protein
MAMDSERSYRLLPIFDDEWDAFVRVEELFRSRLSKTEVRALVEEQRARHRSRPDHKRGDPYHTPHGRRVFDWLQTLPPGSARATELYGAFVEWSGVEITQTRFGRLLGHWLHKRRASRGFVYDLLCDPIARDGLLDAARGRIAPQRPSEGRSEPAQRMRRTR